jgi:hypothetical protein
MNILFFEITRQKDNKRYCFDIKRLRSFEEYENLTMIHLDTKSIIINESYQNFVNRLSKTIN